MIVTLSGPEKEDRLQVIRALASDFRIAYTGHVIERVADGDFTYDDVRTCLTNARRVVKAETDGQALDGLRYVVRGPDTGGCAFYTCGKIVLLGGQRIYQVISAKHYIEGREGGD